MAKKNKRMSMTEYAKLHTISVQAARKQARKGRMRKGYKAEKVGHYYVVYYTPE